MATPGRDVTQKMMEWVIDELRYKASSFNKTGALSVYNGDVVKSDTAVSEATKKSLQSAVKVLEDIPEIYKDYHPGSDGQVLDLVHPSLFPLIYGRSRVLEDTLIGLDDCLQSTGRGIVVPIRAEKEQEQSNNQRRGYYRSNADPPYSMNFQWLPCEVDIAGEDGSVK
jgi:hypothetical protein